MTAEIDALPLEILPQECVTCANKICKSVVPGTLDICDLGVAYFYDGKSMRRKKEAVTMRHIAANLQHELNKVLQFIINEAVEIDANVSLKEIDIDNPASRIVAGTIIIDNFIEMISGVYDFHSDAKAFDATNVQTPLRSTVANYIKTYSLIKNTRRAVDLKIDINIDPKIVVKYLGPVVEYLIAILADNLWKYSLSGHAVEINVDINNENSMLDLNFANYSHSMVDEGALFDKGYQLDKNSEGFGFGLYWANILCSHYNKVMRRTELVAEVKHRQMKHSDNLVSHVFSLTNISFAHVQ